MCSTSFLTIFIDFVDFIKNSDKSLFESFKQKFIGMVNAF